MDTDPLAIYEDEARKKRGFDGSDECETNTHHENQQPDRKKLANNENNTDGESLLKILIPNSTAGALIGKGGATMVELQKMFGGKIQLSPNRSLYPGTSERIVVMVGDEEQVARINEHILDKVQESLHSDERRKDDGRDGQTKVVLTNAAAGLLIGRGGERIKALQEETSVKMIIANRDQSTVNGERVLTMSGTLEHMKDACVKILAAIGKDSTNVANTNINYNPTLVSSERGTSAAAGADFSTGVNMSGGSTSAGACRFKTTVSIEMEVPNILVGSIVGKSGATVNELMRYTGAKIKFSDKSEFAPGTTDRILSIRGDMKQTQTAYLLVNQKLEAAQAELRQINTSPPPQRQDQKPMQQQQQQQQPYTQYPSSTGNQQQSAFAQYYQSINGGTGSNPQPPQHQYSSYNDLWQT